MTTWRKQRRGAMLLTTVVVVTTAVAITAAPVENVQGRAIGQEGGLGWLLNWSGNQEGEADLSEVQLVEEGRRRRVDSQPDPAKPTKNRKSKNTKRVNGTPIDAGGGGGGGGGGGHATAKPVVVFAPPEPVVETYKPADSSTTSNCQNYRFYDYFLCNFFPGFSVSSSFDASFNQGIGTGGGGHGKPVVEDGYGQDQEGQGYGRPEPSKTELLVLRYPDIIKTFAQGVSALNKLWQAFGLGLTKTLENQFTDSNIPTAVGSGVASYIPLHDTDDPHNTGGTLKPPFPYLPPVPTLPAPTFPNLNAYLPQLPVITLPPLPNLLPTYNTGGVGISSSADFSVSNSGQFSIGSPKDAARSADSRDQDANKVS